MAAYFMGIDNGGTSAKCAIFDGEGRMVASASCQIPMDKGKDGRTERDAERIWTENCRIITQALEKGRLSGADITGIGLCGYGGGLGMLDAAMRPVAPFVVSTDARANGLLLAMQQDGVADALYARTLQQPWAGQPAVLLPWYKRHAPEAYARCAHVVQIKDYLRFRLTGRLATEPTDASNTNLLNLRTRRFDEEIFRLLDIAEMHRCFPEPLLSPCQEAGQVTAEAAAQTGLRAGTPVAAGLYDVMACCLASGVLEEDLLCLVVGTWSISGHLTADLRACEGQSTTLLSLWEDRYFLEESSPTSASNLDWFVQQFFSRMLPAGGGDVYRRCDDIIAALNPADSDIVFLPYLYGSNAVLDGKAGFFNLAGHHTAEQMLLAVYEGVLFSLLHHTRNLCEDAPARAARLSGGASRSPVWCQMLADILDSPIETMESAELGALGGAMCAAVAVGAYPDARTAARHMTRTSRAYRPNPARVAVYQEKYQLYQRAIKALRGFMANE